MRKALDRHMSPTEELNTVVPINILELRNYIRSIINFSYRRGFNQALILVGYEPQNGSAYAAPKPRQEDIDETCNLVKYINTDV